MGFPGSVYNFDGTADDDVGSRHGIVHGGTLASDRFGLANRAYYFDEQSGTKITIPTPFDTNSDFTISMWISPAVVGDGVWHGFVGYQPEASNWYDRSPSLSLNNEDNGRTCSLQYDSRDSEDQTRFHGVVLDWFEKDVYVHTLWTGVAGDRHTFYKNGAAAVGDYPAPASFSMHSSYSIGRIGYGTIHPEQRDANGVTGTIDQVEFYGYAITGADVGRKFVAESHGK
jgi:hypothetical protein